MAATEAPVLGVGVSAAKMAVAATAGGLDSLPNPLSGNSPLAPLESAVSWVALAASRSQSGQISVTTTPVTTVATNRAATGPVTAAATTGQKPVFSSPVVGKPDASTGVVTGTVTAKDPGGYVLTYAATTSAKGAVAIDPNTGAFTYAPTAAARHAAARTGATKTATTDTLTVTATNSNGVVATSTVTVTILGFNAAPLAQPVTVGTPSAATGVVIGKIVVTDADGDVLTYKLPSTATAKGTITIDSNTGVFTYTPKAVSRHNAAGSAATSNGSDTFTVNVSDVYGGSVAVPVTVPITPVNNTPTLTATVGKPDFSKGGTVKIALTATDADKDTLSFTTTKPANGFVTLDADGKGFTYEPTNDARSKARSSATAMTDTFTITVSDAHGGSAVVTVTPTIAPWDSAPKQVSPPSIISNPSTGIVTGNMQVGDPDNDPLTYSIVTSTTPKGTVTVNPTTGTFTYTPSAGARHAAAKPGATSSDKTDTFTVKATDVYGMSLAVPVTVSISPFNSAPTGTATAGPPDVGTGTVAGSVTGSDADGDKLKYSITSNDTKGKATINATTGAFIYEPTASARHGAAKLGASPAAKTGTFTVTVTDGYGGSVEVPVTVSIAPINSAPITATPKPSAYLVTGVVTGKVPVTDADRDTLTYSVSAPTSAKGTLVVNGDGSFVYTPTDQARSSASASTATSAEKTDAFIVAVSDGYGGTLDVPVTVTVLPKAAFNPNPTVNSAVTDPTIGLVSGSIVGTDSFGAAMLPSSGTITTDKGLFNFSTDGTFTYVPTPTARHAAAKSGANASTKSDTIAVVIANSQGVSTTTSLSVSISPKNNNPTFKVVQAGQGSTVTSNNVVFGYIAVSDPDGDPLSFEVEGYSAANGPTRYQSVPLRSGSGSVYFWDAGEGKYAFNYAPTVKAQKMAYNQNRPGQDVFNVTFTDGYGGIVNVPVSVPIGMYSENY